MNENEQLEKVEVIDSSIIYNQDKAQIDTMIATAHAFPRNIKRATDNALAIVTIDKETAQTCTYSVPRGGKPITGPSVHLAKILAQVWGNMRIEAKVVSIDAKQVTSEAICFDLENNLAIKTQVKRSIVGKSGRFNDDMITVTGNAANSIALRNAILSVIPRAIVDKVYNSAKSVITGDISDKAKFMARRKQVFDGLRDTYELTEKEILSAVGRAAIDHITPDDLVTLIVIVLAIKDGDKTVDFAFKGKTDKQPKATPEEKELERVTAMLNDCKNLKEINAIAGKIPDKYNQLFIDKTAELENQSKS